MNRTFVAALAAALFVVAPTAAIAQDAPAETVQPKKKRSGFLAFAGKVLQQAVPQILPQDGSLKGVAGQVALSAVETATGGAGQPGGACGGLGGHGEGGSAAPNPQAQAMLGQIMGMMKGKSGGAANIATAMTGGLPGGC